MQISSAARAKDYSVKSAADDSPGSKVDSELGPVRFEISPFDGQFTLVNGQKIKTPADLIILTGLVGNLAVNLPIHKNLAEKLQNFNKGYAPMDPAEELANSSHSAKGVGRARLLLEKFKEALEVELSSIEDTSQLDDLVVWDKELQNLRGLAQDKIKETLNIDAPNSTVCFQLINPTRVNKDGTQKSYSYLKAQWHDGKIHTKSIRPATALDLQLHGERLIVD